MSLSKKAVAVIGGVAGLVGLGWLISRVVAKPSVPVVELATLYRVMIVGKP